MTPAIERRRGHVYFAQIDLGDGALGPIKIGHTRNAIKERIWSLQVSCPWTVRLLGAFAGSRGVEQSLLALFEPWSMGGEWVKPDAKVLRGIQLALSIGCPVVEYQ
jgi:hypothetical protein